VARTEGREVVSLARRIVAGEVPGWAPQSRPQVLALSCPAFELLYGGAAGGGKTDTLLADALRDAGEKHYKGVLFRRSYPELEEVIERARALIPAVYPGAVEVASRHEWRFPAGGKLLFRHLEDRKAAHAHRSAEYSWIGFDELTTFEEAQYRYLLTRARSSKGLRVRIRAATNPGGIGHAWVLKRFAPWLDPDFKGQRPAPGEILYALTHPETNEDIWVPAGTPGALSRTFIPARLEDNRVLEEKDPAYRSRLRAQDPLTRKQLEEGDWSAKPAPKMFFRREWMPLVDRLAGQARRVRYWDRAATEEAPGKDPDWTVGLRVAFVEDGEGGGIFTVEDMVRLRAAPGGVRAKILETAKKDGLGVEQALSLDPGQAGVYEGNDYVDALRGFVVGLYRESGDKLTRAKAVSAQAAPRPGQAVGTFRVVKGDWNGAFFSELEELPEGAHDDIVDALSGAFRVLINGGGCEGDGAASDLADLPRWRGASSFDRADDNDSNGWRGLPRRRA
jgi:predicted phage terminase large subunit-like protein